MKFFSKLVLAAAISSAAIVSHAGVVIDDFTTFQATLSDNTANNSGFASTVSGSMLGGYRELFITVDTQAASGNASTIGVAGGVLDFSTPNSSKAIGGIRWDGTNHSAFTGDLASWRATVNATGLGGQNFLTAGSGFQLTVPTADLAFPFLITAYSNATDFSQVLVTSTGPGTYMIPFGAFVTGSGAANPANFASIGALEGLINFPTQTVSVDFSLDIVSVVPEPGSLALVGIALIGAAGLRRRRKA